MRKVSKKQQRRNREIARLKKALPPYCVICHGQGTDAAHLIPKSIYPEHYTNPLNIVIMCRECHKRYDNDKEFRQKQKRLISIVKSFDELAANRYFDL